MDLRIDVNHIFSILKELNQDSSVVYLAGSIMEGFGNSTSDVDVYVICDKEYIQELVQKASDHDAILPSEKFVIHNIIQDNIRYDFEYWAMDDFLSVVKRLNNLNFSTNGYIERLTEDEFDLMHRFKFGKPIINQQAFQSIYQCVNLENLQYYRIMVNTEVYSGTIEDLQGAYEAGDYGSCFFMVRNLVTLMVTTYLAACGETNPASKWLYRKLLKYQERTCDDTLMKKYIEFQTHPFDLGSIHNYIKDGMRFCQKLNDKVQDMLREKQQRMVNSQ
ncbi:MAG: nucleotidyltransferase domain-containing protein [Brevibacillus sp.]|nr:nucleotidyltransferase domain-containing protein [Brevibacillus sp.]